MTEFALSLVNRYNIVKLTNTCYSFITFQTLINMAYCCLILMGRTIQKIVFGELRISEQQHMKDKLWNFVFYKFIFVFGVVNVQYLNEVRTREEESFGFRKYQPHFPFASR